MSILSIVLFLIKYGPSIWSLVSEIIDLIGKLRGQEAESFKVEMKQAAEHYKANKDRRPLERLRERLRARCLGAECQP